MELQNSVTASENLPPLLWTDAGLRAALSSNAEESIERAWASPESTATRAFSNDDLSEAQRGQDYPRASDDQLLAAAKASDERAFEELCGRHVGSVRKRVHSMVRNSEDTEDVLQDSLLKAYRHLREFKESCSFSTWITRIAINTALMHLRKRKSRREVSFDQASETNQTWSTCDIPDPSPSTDRAYAKRETLEVMLRAVNRLPPLYRGLLEQYHAQEKPLQEAADKLGITVASAKTRLFRARRTLRSMLERQRLSRFDVCY
jgi:RNA polymerase sigma-70 factor (ECF subfamily)